MALDLPALRARLTAPLKRISNFEVQGLRDNPVAPGCMVLPEAPIKFYETFEADFVRPRFSVIVFVPYNDIADSEAQLDDLMSTTSARSVTNAIESVAGANIVDLSSYGVTQFDEGATRYLTATYTVEVWPE